MTRAREEMADAPPAIREVARELIRAGYEVMRARGVTDEALSDTAYALLLGLVEAKERPRAEVRLIHSAPGRPVAGVKSTPGRPQPRCADRGFLVQGRLKVETAKAILVILPEGDEIWLPRSQIVRGGNGSYVVSSWLARKKGWID